MDLQKSGKIIANLRKEAGYTQQSLAEALHITDKAVSKWERGLSVPDAGLLSKLSMLLDADIEYIIAGNNPYGKADDWKGLLIVNDIDFDLYDKPVIYYLLSYFMLVGIKDIEIVTNNKKYIDSLELKKYGVNLFYSKLNSKKTMIVYDKILLFGSNLTRQIHDAMGKEKSTILTLDNEELPIILEKNGERIIENIRKNSEFKNLGRGMININLNSKKKINEASKFIEIYQNNDTCKIADLSEIKIKREL